MWTLLYGFFLNFCFLLSDFGMMVEPQFKTCLQSKNPMSTLTQVETTKLTRIDFPGGNDDKRTN